VIAADRFYNDFHLLNIWDSNGVFFVIRHKENLKYTVVRELDLPDNRYEHILRDEIIELENTKYLRRLRRVAVWIDENRFVINTVLLYRYHYGTLS
jgi:hypothetical protein